jgi:hypothetical protein
MEEAVCEAKTEFKRSIQQAQRVLATTPDDRVNWSPSPTCRTPVHLVAHCAMVIDPITEALNNREIKFDNIAEMEKHNRFMEKEFTTREKAADFLTEKSNKYLSWMESLTDSDLKSTVTTPFGPMPLSVAITLLAGHTRGHAAQAEYIQTIYGDHDWHMGG